MSEPIELVTEDIVPCLHTPWKRVPLAWRPPRGFLGLWGHQMVRKREVEGSGIVVGRGCWAWPEGGRGVCAGSPVSVSACSEPPCSTQTPGGRQPSLRLLAARAHLPISATSNLGSIAHYNVQPLHSGWSTGMYQKTEECTAVGPQGPLWLDFEGLCP